MIQKKDILKMAKHVFRRGQGVPDKRLMHPKRDWTIGLFLFSIVLATGSVFSTQLFISNQDIAADSVVSGEPLPEYNKSLIQKTLEIYGVKRNNFAAQAPIVKKEEDVSTTTPDIAVDQENTEASEVFSEDDTQETDEGTDEEIIVENQEEESEEDEPINLQAN